MNIEKIRGIRPEGIQQNKKPGLKPDLGGPSFKETLNKQLQQTPGLKDAQPTKGIQFSNHAVERLRSRGIQMGPEQMDRLSEAVGRAKGKGSQNSLVLMDNMAMIVSVKNNTVVTVMNQDGMKDHVFTNIDSTVLA